MTREKLQVRVRHTELVRTLTFAQSQMDQIEKSTKSLAPISDNLTQAYTRSETVQGRIPKIIRETETAEKSFVRGHEKVSPTILPLPSFYHRTNNFRLAISQPHYPHTLHTGQQN